MKFSALSAFALIAFSVASSSALATTYSCLSVNEGKEAALEIQSSTKVLWADESESAYSQGVYTGVDTAPYSERKGELQFKLVDYYQTEDSAFYVSIPNWIQKNPKKVQVTVFLDNDDHSESETKYNCKRN